MAAVVIYTVITDGLPFRKDLLTPWMAATLLDFYINVFAISVWVAHKESNWISTAIWICLLICFGRYTIFYQGFKKNISYITTLHWSSFCPCDLDPCEFYRIFLLAILKHKV
jgi:hypothetical protein